VKLVSNFHQPHKYVNCFQWEYTQLNKS